MFGLWIIADLERENSRDNIKTSIESGGQSSIWAFGHLVDHFRGQKMLPINISIVQ